ncbi:MAG: DUF159 family protein, partial [Betaproteobacteria bacterium HGW-Betaproteobacteria-17]
VPSWNRAPSQTGWAIVAHEAGGEARPMRWGLIPAWAKDSKVVWSTINARLETAASKPAFRAAWKQRRCLIPSSGWYEWRRLDEKTKQPWFIHPARDRVLCFAGLWERWQASGGEWLETYSILTRDADPSLRAIHDRMPLVLPPVVFADWLHGDATQAAGIALSAPAPEVGFHPVARAVGNPRNDTAALIEAVAGAAL